MAAIEAHYNALKANLNRIGNKDVYKLSPLEVHNDCLKETVMSFLQEIPRALFTNWEDRVSGIPSINCAVPAASK